MDNIKEARALYRKYRCTFGKNSNLERSLNAIVDALKQNTYEVLEQCMEAYKERLEKQKKYRDNPYVHEAYHFFETMYKTYLPGTPKCTKKDIDHAEPLALVSEYIMVNRSDESTDIYGVEALRNAINALADHNYDDIRHAIHAYRAASKDQKPQHTYGPKRFFAGAYRYWLPENSIKQQEPEMPTVTPDFTDEMKDMLYYPLSIKEMVERAYKETPKNDYGVLWVFVPDNGDRHIAQIHSGETTESVVDAISQEYMERKWSGRKSTKKYIISGRLINVSRDMEYYIRADALSEVKVNHVKDNQIITPR
jgi:hypothetical protein